MIIPIPIPIYSRQSEKIIEVDKHIDTVTVRKSEYDKYKRCWKEMKKFPLSKKYEFVFEQQDPNLRRWGNYIYNLSTDNEEELLGKIAEVNAEIFNRAAEYDKYIEDHRSNIGQNFKRLQYHIKYLKTKWWYQLFFKEDECKKHIMDEKMKRYDK